MLDRLPLELLDEVLDQLPPPTSYDSARERRGTLRACCLVSKRVHSRAVLLLWRDIRLAGLTKLAMVLMRLRQDEDGLKSKANRSFRIEFVDSPTDGNPAVDDVFTVFKLLPNLRDVHLETTDTVDLGALQRVLPNLHSLRLEYASLAEVDAASAFTHLLILELYYVSFSHSTGLSLFSRATTPHLRALVFTAADLTHHPASRPLATELAGDLVEQLEVLQVHAEDDGIFSPSLFLTSTPLLLSTSIVVDLRPITYLPQHLRIVEGSPSRTLDAHKVAVLRSRIEKLSLVSLHLPEALQHRAPGHAEFEMVLGGLLRLCERLGIEVVWSEDPLEDEFSLSPYFWRYAERLKAEKAAVAAAAGQA